MKQIKFTKMQGAGNDFIIIDNREYGFSLEELGRLASKVCRRRVSIGADGLMAVDEAKRDAAEERSDFSMTYFNSDGSLGEMCGNGARCIARYGYEKGLAGEEMTIRVTAGTVWAERRTEREYRIRLNDVTTMELDKELEVPKEIEVPESVSGETNAAGEKTVFADYVELGNPGIPAIAVKCDGIGELVKEVAEGRLGSEEYSKLFKLGRYLCHHPSLPKGANVNFYHIIGGKDIDELTYERGVEDFTLACGTRTGSMVSAITCKGLIDGKGIKVHVPGGILKIDTVTEDKDGERCIIDLFLTGPTNIVSEGFIVDEDLNL